MTSAPSPTTPYFPGYPLFPDDSFGDQSGSMETIIGLIEEARDLLRIDAYDLFEIQQSIRGVLDNISELWPEGGAPKELKELEAVNAEVEARIRERELFLALNIEEWVDDAKRLIQQLGGLMPQLTTPRAFSADQGAIFHLIDQASKIGQSFPGGDLATPVFKELQAAVQKLHLQLKMATSSS